MQDTALPQDISRLEYVGFWPRVVAFVIDSLLYGIVLAIVVVPAVVAYHGPARWQPAKPFAEFFASGPADFLLTWLLPMVGTVLFWVVARATPGKMWLSAQIVDARTGGQPSAAQYVIRYLGYFVSALPLCLGLFWVAFDARKQGWHDKLARTVVVKRHPVD